MKLNHAYISINKDLRESLDKAFAQYEHHVDFDRKLAAARQAYRDNNPDKLTRRATDNMNEGTA